jgi:hypothetical protein
MDKAIKVQWVAALRSGQYAQGYQRLREEDRFCCLGVLCDLAMQEERDYAWQEAYSRVRPGAYAVVGMNVDHDCLPPDGVYSRWAGMQRREVDELASMNDQHYTFAMIADWIEAHL